MFEKVAYLKITVEWNISFFDFSVNFLMIVLWKFDPRGQILKNQDFQFTAGSAIQYLNERSNRELANLVPWEHNFSKKNL